jgi:hypothetical protein
VSWFYLDGQDNHIHIFISENCLPLMAGE